MLLRLWLKVQLQQKPCESLRSIDDGQHQIGATPPSDKCSVHPGTYATFESSSTDR